MTLSIRPARREDVPLLLQLIRDLAEYEKLSHQVVATEEGLAEHLFGPHPVAEALVGEVDGEAAGFALFFRSFSTFLGRPGLYLEDLFVRPAFRGVGLGKALLVELAHLAVARGCGRLEWSVLDWNTPAIGFYRRMGAQPLEEWRVMRLTGQALKDAAGLRQG